VTSVRAALEHATIGANTTTLHELKAQMALGQDSRRQFKLERGASAGSKFGEEFGEEFGENVIFSQNWVGPAKGGHWDVIEA